MTQFLLRDFELDGGLIPIQTLFIGPLKVKAEQLCLYWIKSEVMKSSFKVKLIGFFERGCKTKVTMTVAEILRNEPFVVVFCNSR